MRLMNNNFILSFLVLGMFACTAMGQNQVEEKGQEKGQNPTSDINANPERVVVIGDVHGDYDQFESLLRAVGLVDKKNKWVAGTTHFVQMGDIPDRGPDSRKAMDLLMDLEVGAAKAGGAVTVLIGNHESMMMINDLRYVHPGEYEAFKDKKSKKRRKAYYQQTIDHLTRTTPSEELPKFDKAYKKEWEERFPLGYVEHRIAWAPTGKYGKWVLSHQAVAIVGDSIFAHGGVSSKYGSMPISEINTRIRTELANPNSLSETSLVEDPDGPLWHRGWANSLENEANTALLDEILSAHGVKRMVIAHTPTTPVVLPRFGGKVLMTDVGLSAHYGNAFSALEIVDGKAVAIIGDQKVDLPSDEAGVADYLEKASALLEDPRKISRYINAIAAAEAKAAAVEKTVGDAANDAGDSSQTEPREQSQ